MPLTWNPVELHIKAESKEDTVQSSLTIFMNTHSRSCDICGHVEVRQPQVLQIQARKTQC